jgi:hypothetical protein
VREIDGSIGPRDTVIHSHYISRQFHHAKNIPLAQILDCNHLIPTSFGSPPCQSRHLQERCHFRPPTTKRPLLSPTLPTPRHSMCFRIKCRPATTRHSAPSTCLPRRRKRASRSREVLLRMMDRGETTRCLPHSRSKGRMARRDQRTENRSRISARFVKEVSPPEGICRGIRGYTRESRRSGVRSRDVKQGRVVRTIYNNSEYHVT